MSSEIAENRKLPKILIVDDEVAMVRSLELLLRPIGQIIKSYSVPEAEEELELHKVDCIVTDVSMPEATGLELLERVRKNRPDIPVVIMTAYSSVPQAVEAIQRGAFEYLTKPFENAEMLDTVKKAIQRRGLVEGQTEALPEGWICNSASMQGFLEKAKRLSRLDVPVLIAGQKGVGKQRTARWIFEHSEASQGKSFERVSAQELNRRGPGSFQSLAESADVLYVEEVYILEPELQHAVFACIRKAECRVLASSSAPPSVQAPANFLEDLHSLLRQHVIEVPSLAVRQEDFEALCRQLLQNIQDRMRLKNLQLDPSALSKLQGHHWVENVRELERSLERAAMESKTQVITAEDIRFELPDLSQILPFSIPIEEGWGRMEFFFKSLEKDLIQRAQEKYPGKSNSQIAGILGTTRRILELRMKSYHLRGEHRSTDQ